MPQCLPIAVALATTLALTACSGDNTYKTVKIGDQIWMAENLNFNAEGSVCYNGKPANCDKYGKLYSWEAAMGACPDGWHIPNNADWDKLYRYADGTTGTESLYGSPTAGRYLKATSGWYNNGNGTDKYGFSALPGGYGNSDGSFNGAGYYGYWWSASESELDSNRAYSRDMLYTSELALWYHSLKPYLLSVRCIKD